jgi:hypothetical protein
MVVVPLAAKLIILRITLGKKLKVAVDDVNVPVCNILP